MRKALIKHVEEGSVELGDLAIAAVKRLAKA
jgi:hypothetical protein